MLIWKLDRQIWAMAIKQWYKYVNTSHKLMISVLKPWNKQPRKPSRTSCIIIHYHLHHHLHEINFKVYSINRECSVQQPTYHILPDLKPRIIFPTAYLICTNLPEESVQVLIGETNLRNNQRIAQIFSRN